jgi:hypothetical protein
MRFGVLDGEPFQVGVGDVRRTKSPRLNFDNFYNSFTSNFVILAQDNWINILHDACRCMNPLVPVIFCIITVVFGNIILLNLFLAILLQNFSDASKADKKGEKKIFIMILDSVGTKVKNFFLNKVFKSCKKDDRGYARQTKKDKYKENCEKISDADAWHGGDSLHDKFLFPKHIRPNPYVPGLEEMVPCVDYLNYNKTGPWDRRGGVVIIEQIKPQTFERKDRDKSKIKEIWLQGKTCLCCAKDTEFRVILKRLVQSNFYKWFINVCVILSSVVMAFNQPLERPGEGINLLVSVSGTFFGAIFVMQTIAEMSVHGIYWNGPKSYLRGDFAKFDFILNIIFLMSNIGALGFAKKINVLRSLRIFRLLKIASKNPQIIIV